MTEHSAHAPIYPLQRWLVWLSRIHRCRGFGIQSPTDYAFVRYVINEHWPYYAYEQLEERSWLRRKLGRLFLRLANWRQPAAMWPDDYQEWWRAGCRKTVFTHELQHIELAHISISQWDDFLSLLPHCDQQSVVVVDDIWRNKDKWKEIAHDKRIGTTFDLYYCGIVFFDTKRYKHNYKINF
jgi:hypothetical protein